VKNAIRDSRPGQEGCVKYVKNSANIKNDILAIIASASCWHPAKSCQLTAKSFKRTLSPLSFSLSTLS
jgi:hypothetical protein